MLPLQNIFQSINTLQASTPPSFFVQGGTGSQFGSPQLLGNGQTGLPTNQAFPPGTQFGSSQLLASNGLNQEQFFPQAMAFGQPISAPPQNGQIDIRNPQARQALIQQLSQVAATTDPRSPESQQVQARIAALNNVNPDGSFNPIGQLFQQLSTLEPASAQAQSLMAQISILQQQQGRSPGNAAFQAPPPTPVQIPFSQPQLPQPFTQPSGPSFQASGFQPSLESNPMLALMQGFMQMMGMMFALMSSR